MRRHSTRALAGFVLVVFLAGAADLTLSSRLSLARSLEAAFSLQGSAIAYRHHRTGSKGLIRPARLAGGALPLPGLAIAAQRRPSPLARGPLSESDVIKLLRGRVPAAQVGARARRQGIDFVVTETAEQQLRQAGADDELIRTLRQVQPQGLVWGPARQVASADHGFFDVSNLVTENGKHYLAFTGDDKHVRLASDAVGT